MREHALLLSELNKTQLLRKGASQTLRGIFCVKGRQALYQNRTFFKFTPAGIPLTSHCLYEDRIDRIP